MQRIEKSDARKRFGTDYLSCDKNEITTGYYFGTISKKYKKKNEIPVSEKQDSNSWQKYEF